MIKVLWRKPLPKKYLHKMDTAKQFVHSNEIWYAYEITSQDKFDNLTLVKAELTYNNITLESQLIIYDDDKILCGDKVSVNDILASIKGTNFKVPEKQHLGYIDEVWRRKYLSTPTTGHWDLNGLPILMIKE